MPLSYDLKLKFQSRLVRLREEAQRELDYYRLGSITVRRSGVDVTAETIRHMKITIAEYDSLIAELERELHA